MECLRGCLPCLGGDASDKGIVRKLSHGRILTQTHIVGRRPEDTYAFHEELGDGAFGAVRLAKNKKTGHTVALKSIKKATHKDLNAFVNEVEMMLAMDHPNIVKLYETFEDNRCVYLAEEVCRGGELFDAIVNRDPPHFTEGDAAICLEQIFRAVSYMHSKHVAHRDLKPENFLLVEKDNTQCSLANNTLKVIDFGISKRYTPEQFLKTRAGTAYYCAPEVAQGRYNELCDEWSCGVILFVLLVGYPPFHAERDEDIMRMARKGLQEDSFASEEWDAVSQAAIALVKKLLKLVPNVRITAEDALKDPWIRDKTAAVHSAEHALVDIGKSLVKNLAKFQDHNHIKKAALHVIARHVNEADIKKLRNCFNEMDENGDGLLSLAEMEKGIANANINIPGIKEIFEKVDSDHSGVIDYTEFMAAALDQKLYTQEEVCWEAFRVFDRDGSGKISSAELKEMMNSQNEDGKFGELTDEQIKQLLSEADTNGDGEIDFDEFMAMMRSDSVSAARK